MMFPVVFVRTVIPSDNAKFPTVNTEGRNVRLLELEPETRNGFVANPAIHSSAVAEAGAVVPL